MIFSARDWFGPSSTAIVSNWDIRTFPIFKQVNEFVWILRIEKKWECRFQSLARHHCPNVDPCCRSTRRVFVADETSGFRVVLAGQGRVHLSMLDLLARENRWHKAAKHQREKPRLRHEKWTLKRSWIILNSIIWKHFVRHATILHGKWIVWRWIDVKKSEFNLSRLCSCTLLTVDVEELQFVVNSVVSFYFFVLKHNDTFRSGIYISSVILIFLTANM